MERWLEIAFGLLILVIFAYAALDRLVLRQESTNRRRSTVAELAGRKTTTVDGLLTEIEREVIGDADDSGPVYINFYLYEFTPEGAAAGEKVRGKHLTDRETTLEPGFALRVGRPVRVRYAVDEPAVSELVDF